MNRLVGLLVLACAMSVSGQDSNSGQKSNLNEDKAYYPLVSDIITSGASQTDFFDENANHSVDEKTDEIALLQSQVQSNYFNRLLIVRVASFVVMSLAVLIVYLCHRNKRNQIRLTQKSEDLRSEVEKSKKKLASQVIHMMRINNSVIEIEEKLKELRPKVNGHGMEVQRLINTIKVNRSHEKEWENFEEYFDGINSEFTSHMRERFPELTLNEIRLCSLLRKNLTNQEIGRILCVETKSVTMKKYRLKKKLCLSENQNLIKFLIDQALQVA